MKGICYIRKAGRRNRGNRNSSRNGTVAGVNSLPVRPAGPAGTSAIVRPGWRQAAGSLSDTGR